VQKKIIGDENPVTVRLGDFLEPEFEKYNGEGEKLGIIKKEEDILTYAFYLVVAIKFLKGDAEEELKPPANEMYVKHQQGFQQNT